MQGQVHASECSGESWSFRERYHPRPGNHVEECKLKFSYVPPPRPPSPVLEGSEEGSSPRASVSDNGTVNASEYNTISRAHVESQDNTSEVKSLISRLSEEKSSAIQQISKLQRELDLLKRERNRNQGGIPLMYVIIVGLVGAILGYLLKRT